MEGTKYTLIIPAAGIGSRLGEKIPKQFLKINGKEIIIHTIEAFTCCDHPPENIIFSCSEELYDNLNQILKTHKVENFKLVIGGKTRQESVYNALKNVKSSDFVLIHDSVRPFVSGNLINQLLESLKKYKAVIPVIPVKDTIKVIKDGIIQTTLNRSELFAAQTPQGFDFQTILDFNISVKDFEKITDDASIIELGGEEVRVIKGDEKNFKITTKDDLERAKNLI